MVTVHTGTGATIFHGQTKHHMVCLFTLFVCSLSCIYILFVSSYCYLLIMEQHCDKKFTSKVVPVVELPSSSSPPPEVQRLSVVMEQTIFDNDLILQHILSYVGNYQYLFVANVNCIFRNAYTTLFPTKETYYNASTMEHTRLCYNGEHINHQRSLLCNSAAAYGNIEALNFLAENHVSLRLEHQPISEVIVKNGHLHVLEWVLQNNNNSQQQLRIPWYDLMTYAARHGNLTILQWLYTNGGPLFSERTCQLAAIGGHLHILKWLHRYDCPVDASIFAEAAYYGHVDVLEWAHTCCPWSSYACASAARGGHLHVLKWLRSIGCPWNDMTCSHAALGGHLEILQWARENRCSWCSETCSYAAEEGHLDILKWAHENGCPWDSRTCAKAALSGHLEVLQWARKNDCPWNERTCSFAAMNGHLNVLQWAHFNGCPWDEETCTNAERNNHLDLLQWAKEHGCPWSVLGM
jgi:hypothetical protein